MFLGIVLYHILLRVKSGVDIKVLIKKNVEIFMSKLYVKKKELQADNDDIVVNISAHCEENSPYKEYRESLLAIATN